MKGNATFSIAVLLFSCTGLAQPRCAEGFCYPVNPPDGSGNGWYIAQGFQENGNHLGEDWNWGSHCADEHSPVYAVADGVIRWARVNGDCWRGVILIDHCAPEGSAFSLPGGGTAPAVSSFYAHLDPSTVENWVNDGATVVRGQQIGEIGPRPYCGAACGGFCWCHLHFEIRTNLNIQEGPGYGSPDGWVNPSQFIELNRGGEVAVGEGAEGNGPQLFIDAYNRYEGHADWTVLSRVFREGPGQIQRFRFPDGTEAAITLADGVSYAQLIYGSIYTKWGSLGRGNFLPLGYPHGEQGTITPPYESPYWCCGPSNLPEYHTGGKYQRFQNGTINHINKPSCHPQYGQSYEVHGGNFQYFQTQNYASWMGFPISDVQILADGSEFTDVEGGYILTAGGVTRYVPSTNPRNLQITQASGTIGLSWTVPTCIADYVRVLRRSGSSRVTLDEPEVIATLPASTTQYSDSSASPGMVYAYQVTALADTIMSPPSDEVYGRLRTDTTDLYLISAECFFDSDPGSGFGQPIAVYPDDETTLTKGISVSSLASGFHRLFLRYRDSRGIWSAAEGRSFYVTPPVPQGNFTINAAETFYDDDPGVGNGDYVPVTADDEVTVTATQDASYLSPGFHRLYLRYRTNGNVWSATEGRSFYVTPPIPEGGQMLASAEYFLDSDPGLGQGHAVDFPDSSEVTLTEAITPFITTTGFHRLYLRYQTAGGIWSAAEGRSLYVTPWQSDSLFIAGGEIFIDSLGSYGEGIAMEADDGGFDENEEDMHKYQQASSLTLGQHFVYARVRDNRGLWSNVVLDSFTVVVLNEIRLVALPEDSTGEHVRLAWTSFPEAIEYHVHYDSIATGAFAGFITVVAPDTTALLETPPGSGGRFFQVIAILPSRSLIARSPEARSALSSKR